MARAISIEKLKSKKFITFPFSGIWKSIFGTPETTGVWICYGSEKNGKTRVTIKIAEYLSQFERTLYVSAEEGLSMNLRDTIDFMNIDTSNKNLQFSEYQSIEEISEKMKNRKSHKVVVFDNVTIYQDELSYGKFRKLVKDHPNKLFVFVAHAEGIEPYGATAKLIKKLSKVIIRVEGLKAFVGGRVPGGVLEIDEDKGDLFHGAA